MRRSPALLIALLLLASGVVAPFALGADSGAQANPRIAPVNDTANYLTVPDERVTRTGATADGIALSTAIDGDTTALRSDFVLATFEQSFDRASSSAEKADAIRNAADRIERRQQTLWQRDRTAINAYANGSMTAAEFTRERARIHQEAERLQATTDRIRTVARNDNSFSLSFRLGSRLSGLSGKLEALQGPVTDHVARAAGGSAPGENIYVEATDDGYTLAYVTDDTYVRETYLGGEFDTNGTDSSAPRNITSQNGALDRTNRLYPWVDNYSISPTVRYLGASEIYKYSAQHTRGELIAYLNARTGNVFREAQRHKLSAMPVANTVTSHNNSLDMQVNKTYESGPLHVQVTENGTETPVDTTVTVNGDAVGRTGDDGRLWIVEPRGPDRVRATTADNETVSVYLPS